MTNLLNLIFLTKILTTVAIPIDTSSNETVIRSDCEDINPLCSLFLFGPEFCNENFVEQECPKSCNVCAKYKGIKPTEGLNLSVVSQDCKDNVLCQYFPSYGPDSACKSPGPFRDLGKQHCPQICDKCQMSKDDTCVAINGPQQNSPCIFPFKYKEKDYEACTDFEHTQHWCSTKVDTNGNHIDGQWGDCGVLCPKVEGDNDEAAFCDKCVKDFDGAGGCECMDNDDCDQLSLIPEGCFICGQKAMEYCESKIDEAKTDSKDTCMTSSGPKSNALCVFPFHFKGKFYESCTSAGHTQNWCATKVGSNDSYVENEWGNCNDNCAYEAMCTGNFMERYPSDAGNGIQRPPAGSKCAKPCVFESGRWGSSWCYTEENGSEEKGSQWGAECVSCQEVPVECQWSSWSITTECSNTCGFAQRTKHRKKLVMESHGGQCKGQAYEIEKCEYRPCLEECHPLSKTLGRCGPEWGGRCNKDLVDYAVYCNVENGWCGTSDDHKDAQDGDEYDWQSKTCKDNSTTAAPKVTTTTTLPTSADGKLLPHSFIGFCKYGSGESNEITDVRTKTTLKCQQQCEKTANCTAFSFNTNVIRNCELYEGGPYTYGYNIYDSKGTKNDTSVKCYIIPSKEKSPVNADDDYGYYYDDDAQIEEEEKSEPKVVSKAQRLEVKKNEIIKLFCDVQDLGQNQVIWTHINDEDGEEDIVIAIGNSVLTGDQRITIENENVEGNDRSTLLIGSAKLSDSGQYKCEISVPGGKNNMHTVVVSEPLTTPPPETGCKICVNSFSEAGGCECIDNDDCDQFALIPEGCFNCGNDAMQYCSEQNSAKDDGEENTNDE